MITWGTLTATLMAPLVFLLPGWALLSLMLPPERLATERAARPDVVAWLTLSAGVSLAMAPVALLALDLLGLRAGTAGVLVILGLSAAVVAWRRGPRWRERLAELDLPLLALAVTMLLVVGVRLWVVRGINVGFWGDSYQHTMMTQLILDHGGLFDSWEPYAPLQSFTYHFGLHSALAVFQWATGWLTGNPTPRTVALVGQFLNALAALALYPLAVRLSRGDRWVGVGAVLIAGLLTPMPMFYVNWGRYTQLAGQILLPAALWFTMEAMESRRRDPRRQALAVVAAAGLALTHYFVLAFYVTFLIPYVGAWLLGCWQEGKASLPQGAPAGPAVSPPDAALQGLALKSGRLKYWAEGPWRLLIIGTCACLLCLPWFLRLLEGLLPSILTGFIQGTPPEEFIRQENMFYPLAQFVPHYVAILAGIGGLWALVRRQQVAILLLWVGFQFLLSNPHWVRLPGTAVVNNFTVELSLYIPAAILASYTIVTLLRAAWRHAPHASPAVTMLSAALFVAAAVVGVYQRKDVIDPHFQLVTPADEAALAWVQHNTPEDALFLANSFFAYGGTLIVGSDAGWWLPLLAGRQNTVPPLNYGGEAGPDPGYGQRINDRARYLEEHRLDNPETVRYLRQQGISHVFVGEKGGPLLDRSGLLASPWYRLLYPVETGSAVGEGIPGPLVFEVIAP
jgi:hypothetical protein